MAAPPDADEPEYQPEDEWPLHFQTVRGSYYHFMASMEQKGESTVPVPFCQDGAFKLEAKEPQVTDHFTLPEESAWCRKCIRRMPAGLVREFREVAS